MFIIIFRMRKNVGLSTALVNISATISVVGTNMDGHSQQHGAVTANKEYVVAAPRTCHAPKLPPALLGASATSAITTTPVGVYRGREPAARTVCVSAMRTIGPRREEWPKRSHERCSEKA